MDPHPETWVGELPVNAKLMYGSERLRLLFTSNRILVDRVGKRGPGAVVGTSLFGRIGEALEDMFKSGRESTRKKRIGEMTPEQVLHAHQDNFAIDYTEVVSVAVEQTETLAKITILTGGDKLEFSSRTSFGRIVELFRNRLGDKLTVHRLSKDPVPGQP